MWGATRQLAEALEDARPDVIVAILDDHFENHFRNLLPSLGIGIAAAHHGPSDHLLEFLRFEEKKKIAGLPDMAAALLVRLVAAEFDVARCGEVEYGNNLMVPLQLIRPQYDLPIVPVFINVFTPPLISMKRAYAFGAALRTALEALPDKRRVAILATGGLSHWPPVWREDSPESDAFLQRMKRFQSMGREVLRDDCNLWIDLGKYEIEMAERNQFPLNSTHPLMNARWDQRFLTALRAGDVEYVCRLDTEEINREAGHGGLEVLNWAALMGAMRGRPAKVLEYEAVREWITGTGFVLYEGR
jgi:2,3-dihydroxyphenylpropionate 1,2-dioxygenase